MKHLRLWLRCWWYSVCFIHGTPKEYINDSLWCPTCFREHIANLDKKPKRLLEIQNRLGEEVREKQGKESE